MDMEISKWIKQAIARCKAKTPKVFRKVQYTAGAASAVIIAIYTQLNNYDIVLPDWFSDSAPYIIGFSTGLVTLSQFTQKYDSNGQPMYGEEEV